MVGGEGRGDKTHCGESLVKAPGSLGLAPLPTSTPCFIQVHYRYAMPLREMVGIGARAHPCRRVGAPQAAQLPPQQPTTSVAPALRGAKSSTATSAPCACHTTSLKRAVQHLEGHKEVKPGVLKQRTRDVSVIRHIDKSFQDATQEAAALDTEDEMALMRTADVRIAPGAAAAVVEAVSPPAHAPAQAASATAAAPAPQLACPPRLTQLCSCGALPLIRLLCCSMGAMPGTINQAPIVRARHAPRSRVCPRAHRSVALFN